MAEALIACLDDYTIDSRGDVGSWIRLEAIDAVLMALRKGILLRHPPEVSPTEADMLSRIGRLAAEKLDKVRSRAWSCLAAALELLGETT